MALITTREMLKKAQAEEYAVGAFNVENMEMVLAVIRAAEELSAPVMLQTTPSTVRYAGLAMFHGMISAAAKNASVEVALHLDHGDSAALCLSALETGYTSVMIDGSHEDFEGNIAVTRTVVAAAKILGIPVEAELGKVGGKEDDLECEEDTNTDPTQAALFVKETGIDSLAVAIGTAHGFYQGTPVLDKERLSEIRKVVDIPLVLHGASGLSDTDVRDCIRRGICKVNFATELRVAFTDGVKQALGESPSVYDPKVLGKAGMAKVTELVKGRMHVCGCDGKSAK